MFIVQHREGGPGDCVEMCLLCEHREGGQEIVLICVYCVNTGKEARRLC